MMKRNSGLRIGWSFAVILTLLLTLAGGLAAPGKLSASPEAAVFLEGPTEPVTPSSNFEVRLKIGNVSNLYGGEFHLSFDPNLMEVVDADGNPANGTQIGLGPVLTNLSWPQNPPEGWQGAWPPPYETPYFTINSANNTNGTITFAFTLLNPTPPLSITNAQSLAIITFHCKGAGEGQIIFSNPVQGEPPVKLADFQANPIPYGELKPITIRQGLGPDLVILEKYEEWQVEGQTYKVFFTVKNIGLATAPAGHDVGLYIDAAPVGTVEVGIDLQPGQVFLGQFGPITLSGQFDEIKVYADVNNEVQESREDNNSLTNIWPAHLEWNVQIQIATQPPGVAKRSSSLDFGVVTGAPLMPLTDASQFDERYHASAPPPPPGDYLDTYFWWSENFRTPFDARQLIRTKLPPDTQVREWLVRTEYKAEGPAQVSITWMWDASAVPEDLRVMLIDLENGAQVDMKQQNSYQFVISVPEGQFVSSYQIRVVASKFVTKTLEITPGWQMIALTVQLQDRSVSNVLSGLPVIGSVFTWNPSAQTYVPVTEFEYGKSYWVLGIGEGSKELVGLPLTENTVNLSPAGWHMVGGIYVPGDGIAQFEAVEGQIFSQGFAWNPIAQTYEQQGFIKDGQGLWLLVLSDSARVRIFPASP